MRSEEVLSKVAFPIVVSGASGAGKTTLCHELIAREERITFSVSATTRPARGSERHGDDYFFVTEEEFERMRAGGELVEWAEVHDKFYGTPRTYVDERIAEGVSVLCAAGNEGSAFVRSHCADEQRVRPRPVQRDREPCPDQHARLGLELIGSVLTRAAPALTTAGIVRRVQCLGDQTERQVAQLLQAGLLMLLPLCFALHLRRFGQRYEGLVHVLESVARWRLLALYKARNEWTFSLHPNI